MLYDIVASIVMLANGKKTKNEKQKRETNSSKGEQVTSGWSFCQTLTSSFYSKKQNGWPVDWHGQLFWQVALESPASMIVVFSLSPPQTHSKIIIIWTRCQNMVQAFPRGWLSSALQNYVTKREKNVAQHLKGRHLFVVKDLIRSVRGSRLAACLAN